MSLNALQQRLEDGNACPEGVEFAGGFDTFAALWNGIERHDWLFWLVRHFPGEFLTSVTDDALSAAQALADARTADMDRPALGLALELEADSCRIVRLYIRLRA